MEFIDSNDFIEICFTQFAVLKNAIDEYIKATKTMKERQDKFKKWQIDGEIIEAEIIV